MALTPDLSAGYLCCSFLLKAYFTFVWPHVIYPPVLFVDNETRVVLISVTRGQMGADCDMFHPLPAIIRPAGGTTHNHYQITMLLFIPPRPPTASWRLPLKYSYHHYPAPSPPGPSGFFLIFCIRYDAAYS